MPTSAKSFISVLEMTHPCRCMIIAGDETCIYGNDSETKQAFTMEEPMILADEKVKGVHSLAKCMLAALFDIRITVNQRLVLRGQTVIKVVRPGFRASKEEQSVKATGPVAHEKVDVSQCHSALSPSSAHNSEEHCTSTPTLHIIARFSFSGLRPFSKDEDQVQQPYF